MQFVDPNYPYPALSFASLSIILQIISMAYLTILIFSGVKLADFFNTRYKVAAVGVACVGVLFCGFGLKSPRNYDLINTLHKYKHALYSLL